MTVRKALSDNGPTANSAWGVAGRKDTGAVEVRNIFAWHDESLLLVLCIAEQETTAHCADLRMTLGQTAAQRGGLFERRGNSSTSVDTLVLPV